MASEFQKATIDAAIIRQRYLSSSGSESTACDESEGVNVGDPSLSCKEAGIDRQV